MTWAVMRFLQKRSRGPSRIRAEHLQYWLHAATWENLPDPTNWEKVDGLIQATFREDCLLEECTWQILVLIPKVNCNS